MLVIRREQMARFGEMTEEGFLRDVFFQLRTCFPGESALATWDSFEFRAHNAVECARRFGIKTGPDAARYIALDVVFGSGFIALPENEWMLEYLVDPRVPSASSRITRLYQAAIRELQVETRNKRILESGEEEQEL